MASRTNIRDTFGSNEKIETNNDGRKIMTIAHLTRRGSDELIQVDYKNNPRSYFDQSHFVSYLIKVIKFC